MYTELTQKDMKIIAWRIFNKKWDTTRKISIQAKRMLLAYDSCTITIMPASLSLRRTSTCFCKICLARHGVFKNILESLTEDEEIRRLCTICGICKFKIYSQHFERQFFQYYKKIQRVFLLILMSRIKYFPHCIVHSIHSYC